MQNKYYILKPAVDTEETGHVFPAVESYPDYDFKGPRSVHSLRAHKQGNDDIDFKFKLAKGAKFVDLLSHSAIGGVGLLISKELHSFFQSYRIVPHKIYNVPIAAGSELKNYCYIHFLWEDWAKYVNWELTTFRLFENNKFSPIVIDSYEHYLLEIRKSNYFRIGTDKVVLNEIPYDVFSHPFIGTINLSERVANDLLKTDFTGIEITR